MFDSAQAEQHAVVISMRALNMSCVMLCIADVFIVQGIQASGKFGPMLPGWFVMLATYSLWGVIGTLLPLRAGRVIIASDPKLRMRSIVLVRYRVYSIIVMGSSVSMLAFGIAVYYLAPERSHDYFQLVRCTCLHSTVDLFSSVIPSNLRLRLYLCQCYMAGLLSGSFMDGCSFGTGNCFHDLHRPPGSGEGQSAHDY